MSCLFSFFVFFSLFLLSSLVLAVRFRGREERWFLPQRTCKHTHSYNYTLAHIEIDTHTHVHTYTHTQFLHILHTDGCAWKQMNERMNEEGIGGKESRKKRKKETKRWRNLRTTWEYFCRESKPGTCWSVRVFALAFDCLRCWVYFPESSTSWVS